MAQGRVTYPAGKTGTSVKLKTMKVAKYLYSAPKIVKTHQTKKAWNLANFMGSIIIANIVSLDDFKMRGRRSRGIGITSMIAISRGDRALPTPRKRAVRHRLAFDIRDKITSRSRLGLVSKA